MGEHLATENGLDTFRYQARLLGEPGKDLRFIMALGELEDDGISGVDLEKRDGEMDFNGAHAFLNKHPQYTSKMTRE